MIIFATDWAKGCCIEDISTLSAQVFLWKRIDFMLGYSNGLENYARLQAWLRTPGGVDLQTFRSFQFDLFFGQTKLDAHAMGWLSRLSVCCVSLIVWLLSWLSPGVSIAEWKPTSHSNVSDSQNVWDGESSSIYVLSAACRLIGVYENMCFRVL